MCLVESLLKDHFKLMNPTQLELLTHPWGTLTHSQEQKNKNRKMNT